MSSSLFDLHDKVALVTGATRGLGRAIAERMAEAGAQIIVSSEDAANCESAAAELLDNPKVMVRRLALTPLRRAGEPDEIAGVAVMPAAPAGAFITGQNLIVDGGTTIGDGN